MVTAVVLINSAHGRVNEVAERLVAMPQIAEVYSVGGRVDLVAIVRVKSNEEIADVVTNHMQQIPNIQNTETLIAFRAFSRHDLERMFAIGFESE